MTPLRPYLFRAVFDWTLDNGHTPHILVDAGMEGVHVPQAFVRDGQITLNIHPDAVHDFVYDNERLAFSARFDGKSQQIELPMQALLAIFSKENGRGLFFQAEPTGEPPPATPPKAEGMRPSIRKKTPALKIVK